MGVDVLNKKTLKSVVGLALAVMVVVVVGPVSSVAAEEELDAEALSECDQFMESYVRSSARKLWRSLSRGAYELETLDIGDVLEISAEDLGADESVEFEVLLEEEGRIAGLVDRDRTFEKTFVVVDSVIGPIMASHTWQARHLRDSGQDCEPIASAVERPERTASTVDVEPFRYWGLRIAWRIPDPDNATATDETIKEVVAETMRRFLEDDDQ